MHKIPAAAFGILTIGLLAGCENMNSAGSSGGTRTPSTMGSPSGSSGTMSPGTMTGAGSTAGGAGSSAGGSTSSDRQTDPMGGSGGTNSVGGSLGPTSGP